MKFSLKAGLGGVSSITSVQEVGSALSGATGPSYSSGAMMRVLLRNNKVEQVYMWTFNADNFTLIKNGDSVSTECSDGASLAMTISNMTGQCYADFMSPTVPSKQMALSASSLAVGSFDFAEPLT